MSTYLPQSNESAPNRIRLKESDNDLCHFKCNYYPKTPCATQCIYVLYDGRTYDFQILFHSAPFHLCCSHVCMQNVESTCLSLVFNLNDIQNFICEWGKKEQTKTVDEIHFALILKYTCHTAFRVCERQFGSNETIQKPNHVMLFRTTKSS